MWWVWPGFSRTLRPDQSMRRTYDPDANRSYDYLQAGVKEALSASLLAMDEDGVQVALLPGTQRPTQATTNAEHRTDEWCLVAQGCRRVCTRRIGRQLRGCVGTCWGS